MSNDPVQMFWIFMGLVAMVAAAGAYLILITRNLIRVLIGLEILTKAVSLLIIVVGYLTGNIAMAQSFVITLIIVEVVIIAVAAGIIVGVFKQHGSVDSANLRNLKG